MTASSTGPGKQETLYFDDLEDEKYRKRAIKKGF